MLDRIIMAGSGGQGIQFAGQLLALAAVEQGLKATYVPSYGAERRGGPSFCTVVVGDHEIYAPVFKEADILLAFDQRARNQYAHTVKESGLILADNTLCPKPAECELGKVILLDGHQTALAIRKERSAYNLVMLGAYIGLDRGIQLDNVLEVLNVKSSKKPELLETNSLALKKGVELIKAGVK